MKTLKKATTVVLTVLLVFALAVILVNLFLNIRYSEFYLNSESVGEVAGIGDGLVHQGVDYVEEYGMLLTSGYMADGSASRIYVNVDGEERYTVLKNTDGSDYLGHAGGITHFGPYLYVGTTDGIDVFSLEDIIEGAESTKSLGFVRLENTASWLTVHDGMLYAGLFAKKGSNSPYSARPEHLINNPSDPDEENYAVINEYKLNSALISTETFGVSTTPERAFSITANVQGGVFTDSGELILASSWGLDTSRIYFYDITTIDEKPCGTITADDGTVTPVYFLGKDSLKRTVDAPPMAEELIIIGNRLYVMNESASKKYIFGNLTGGRELYAYSLK